MRFAHAIAAVTVSALPLVASAQEADLRFKAPAGAEVRYHWSSMRTEKVAKADNAEAVQNTAASTDIDLLVRIKERSETGLTAELVIEGLKTVAQSDKGPMEFDSKWPQEKLDKSPFARMFKPVIGTVLTLKVDATGAITEVTGAESLSKDKITAAAVKMMLDPSVIKGRFWALFTMHNPSEKVAVGATWRSKQASTVFVGIDAEVVREHSLAAADAKSATVSYTGAPVLLEPTSPEHGTREIKGSSIVGNATWDLEKGTLAEITSSTGLTLELTREATADKPRIHLFVDSTNEVTLKRVN